MSEIFDIARIDKDTFTVVNIERADQEWIDANADDPKYMFVKTPDDFGTDARIDHSYDIEYGLFGNPYFLFPPVELSVEPDFDEQLAAYEANQ